MITLEQGDLHKLLAEAARLGATQAIEDLHCFHYQDACKLLGVSPNTLRKRIREGKIKQVDGRISGREIRRYLNADE